MHPLQLVRCCSCKHQCFWPGAASRCNPLECKCALPNPSYCPSAAGGQLSWWSQCGGNGGSCSQYTCLDGTFPGWSCAAGSACIRQSSYLWQCTPGGGPGPGPAPGPTPGPGRRHSTECSVYGLACWGSLLHHHMGCTVYTWTCQPWASMPTMDHFSWPSISP
jgi:hypothetical protein